MYYHYYSGEYPASVHALEVVYDWILRQKVFPIFASRYIEIVQGFISTRIERLGEHSWLIKDNGECRTIRFDTCPLFPDLENSKGILGFTHYQGSIYVFLDESEEHTLVLVREKPSQPYLANATAYVNHFQTIPDGGFSFRTQGLGKATFEWNNLPPEENFLVHIESKKAKKTIPVKTDVSGRLNFSLNLKGAAEITVASLRTLGDK